MRRNILSLNVCRIVMFQNRQSRPDRCHNGVNICAENSCGVTFSGCKQR
jgi:hypothetical protein